MTPWKLIYNRFDPDQEALREALCTLGNGYLGTRGAVPETTASRVHYPGTYIAGVYNALTTDIAGRSVVNEDFVNCPNWLMLNIRIHDGPWFNRLEVKILSWKVELNMRRGVLSRRVRWQDDRGRVTLIENHRIVSMADPHLCALRYTIIPENYDGVITIRSGIDGQIVNAGVERYKQLKNKHLEPLSHGSFGPDGIFLQMQTTQSRIQITEALRTIVSCDHEPLTPDMHVVLLGRERIMQEFSLPVVRGQKYTVEKLVSVYTSRDHGVADDCRLAQDLIGQVDNFQGVYFPHQAQWAALWKKFDIEVDGDLFVQRALRFQIFHLLQSASSYNENIDAGLPARGLHGEAYRGHIFWDEIFAYPFYTLHAPEITRALLMYRSRRLNAAKDNARQNGGCGAMYPWQSASTGEETTQVLHLNPVSGTWGPDYSSLQRHVSLAIAYNVLTYCHSSGDRDFMERYGVEMLVEIARFWSGITQWNKKNRRFEIAGVMGPDEFHEKYPGTNRGGLKNNAYTNVMVVWLLRRTLAILDTLSEEDRHALLMKTQVEDNELARWKDITVRMTIPVDPDGLIYQFEGYMDLAELDWDGYRSSYGDISRMDRILKAEGLSPDSYKVAKQADTIMLFYLLGTDELEEIFAGLGYPFPRDIVRKNFDYYLPRTSHGSTLSRIVHAHVAEKLGNDALAVRFFYDALRSDLYDLQGGTTQEGIHVGVMAGSVDLFLRFFAGISLEKNLLSINPKLPETWQKIKCRLRYRNVWFKVAVDHKDIRVLAEPLREMSLQMSSDIPVQINHQLYALRPRRLLTVPL